MLIVDEPAWRERRCSVISPSPLSALVINPTYNMVPCRGRGRLLGSKGPLFLMRAPVPAEKRSTFTSRGYMTGYTINPCIGSTSTSLTGHVSAYACSFGYDERNMPHGQNDSTADFDAGHENIILQGRRTYILLRISDMFMHITRDHMSRKS